MMTFFTISQTEENFLQQESVSILYNKHICIQSYLIKYRCSKILILNYFISPGCFKYFLSDSSFSKLKTILEHFSSKLCFFICSLFIKIYLLSLLKPSASQPPLSFFHVCHLSHSPEKFLCSCLGNLHSKLHVFRDTHEYYQYRQVLCLKSKELMALKDHLHHYVKQLEFLISSKTQIPLDQFKRELTRLASLPAWPSQAEVRQTRSIQKID